MSRKRNKSEVEIAKHVVSWLESQHWTVYQEVQPKSHGPIADIVATQKGNSGIDLLWVVEVKTSLSLSVIAQAHWWKNSAHWVSIAAPQTDRQSVGRDFAKRILAAEGIGLVLVNGSIVQAANDYRKLNRRPLWASSLLTRMTEEQRAFGAQAGSRNGHWTPFKQTCLSVLRFVRSNPGCSARELIDGIERHHYNSDATARSCLLRWADEGMIPGVRLEREGKSLRLYPAA